MLIIFKSRLPQYEWLFIEINTSIITICGDLQAIEFESQLNQPRTNVLQFWRNKLINIYYTQNCVMYRLYLATAAYSAAEE